MKGRGRADECRVLGLGWVGFIVDWIPLSVGSVRPTQGRTVGLAQVSQLGPRSTKDR